MNRIAFAHLLLASTMVAGGASAQSASQVVGLPPQPEPYATESVVNHPKTIGWPEGRKPVAPRGYEVVKFAGGLDYPRQALLLPNGDVIVAEARTKPKLDADPEVQRGQALSKTTGFSANRPDAAPRCGPGRRGGATLRIARGAEPAVRDAICRWAALCREHRRRGKLSLPAPARRRSPPRPKPLIALPAGGYNNHWTRNLLAQPRWPHALCLGRLGFECRRVRYGRGEASRRHPRG